MTEIQKEALPKILEGHDVIAQSKTGSGKTVAFGIGLVNNLNVNRFRIQSLVLCPTRELANQVAVEIRKLIRFIPNIKVLTLCGGVPYRPQVNSLYHNAHIIIGTPGRVLKHLKEENLKFDEVDFVVLDEADKMLDMGFSEDIGTIFNYIPKQRQSLLFSATYQENIEELSSKYLNNPINIHIENKTNNIHIKQEYVVTKDMNESKTTLLPSIFSTYQSKTIIIFCNMKITCESVADDLYELGFDVLTLHSNLDQKDRDETITLFANKSYPILIATDVASRGLDIKDVDLVINYDMAKDLETYTHRIGRTGREDKLGHAISLIKEDETHDFQDMIEASGFNIEHKRAENLEDNINEVLKSEYRSVYINGGKKEKVRAGDILGSFIKTYHLNKEDIGNITIFPYASYVAIKVDVFNAKFKDIETVKIKNKYFKMYEK